MKDSLQIKPIPGRQRGFSLVTVLVFAVLAGIWLTAATTSVLPLYQKVGQTKYKQLAREAAEYGIEQTLGSLNATITAGPSAPFDGLQIGQSLTSVIPVPTPAGPVTSASVTVTNQAPPNTSSIYDPLSDPSNSQAQVHVLYGGKNVNDWRTVSAVGTCGSTKYTIAAVLKPIYNFNVPKVTSPTFMYGMFGAAEVSLLNNVTTVVSNSNNFSHFGAGQSLGIGVDAESPQKIGSNVFVNGSVELKSALPSAYGSATNIINNTLFFPMQNNNPSGFTAFSNVLGNQPTGPPNPTPIENPPNLAIATMAPAPLAPTNAVNLGFVTATTQAPNLNLPSGDYVISGMSLPTGTSLNVTSGTVNLYLQDNGVGTSAVTVNIGGSVNGGGNLNVFYNGTRSLNISTSNPVSLNIYAPNAAVNIGNPSAGTRSNYSGSIAAGTLRAQNVSIQFPTPSASAAAINSVYLPPGGTLQNFQLLSLRAISWQEFQH